MKPRDRSSSMRSMDGLDHSVEPSVALSLLPTHHVKHVMANTNPQLSYHHHHYIGTVLFADMSGFSALTSVLASISGGTETLQSLLSEWLGFVVALCNKAGGDVLQFSGDAVLIGWMVEDTASPPLHIETTEHIAGLNPETLAILRGTAVQAARVAGQILNTQAKWSPELPNASVASGAMPTLKELGAHIGVGAGSLSICAVGDVRAGWIPYSSGTAVVQGCVAMDEAGSGTVGVTPLVHALLSAHIGEKIHSTPVGKRGYVSIDVPTLLNIPEATADSLAADRKELVDLGLNKWRTACRLLNPLVIKEAPTSRMLMTGRLIGTCVAPEIRHVVAIFVSIRSIVVNDLTSMSDDSFNPDLPRQASSSSMGSVRSESADFLSFHLRREGKEAAALCKVIPAVEAVQDAAIILQHQCSLNRGLLSKLMCDDKGVTALILWGVPGYVYDDAPRRALRTSLGIVRSFTDKSLAAHIGISSGSCYSGLVGGGWEHQLDPNSSPGRKETAASLLSPTSIASTSTAAADRKSNPIDYKFFARYDFTVLGPTINRAARLMAHAGREADNEDALSNYSQRSLAMSPGDMGETVDSHSVALCDGSIRDETHTEFIFSASHQAEFKGCGEFRYYALQAAHRERAGSRSSSTGSRSSSISRSDSIRSNSRRGRFGQRSSSHASLNLTRKSVAHKVQASMDTNLVDIDNDDNSLESLTNDNSKPILSPRNRAPLSDPSQVSQCSFSSAIMGLEISQKKRTGGEFAFPSTLPVEMLAKVIAEITEPGAASGSGVVVVRGQEGSGKSALFAAMPSVLSSMGVAPFHSHVEFEGTARIVYDLLLPTSETKQRPLGCILEIFLRALATVESNKPEMYEQIIDHLDQMLFSNDVIAALKKSDAIDYDNPDPEFSVALGVLATVVLTEYISPFDGLILFIDNDEYIDFASRIVLQRLLSSGSSVYLFVSSRAMNALSIEELFGLCSSEEEEVLIHGVRRHSLPNQLYEIDESSRDKLKRSKSAALPYINGGGDVPVAPCSFKVISLLPLRRDEVHTLTGRILMEQYTKGGCIVSEEFFLKHVVPVANDNADGDTVALSEDLASLLYHITAGHPATLVAYLDDICSARGIRTSTYQDGDATCRVFALAEMDATSPLAIIPQYTKKLAAAILDSFPQPHQVLSKAAATLCMHAAQSKNVVDSAPMDLSAFSPHWPSFGFDPHLLRPMLSFLAEHDSPETGINFRKVHKGAVFSTLNWNALPVPIDGLVYVFADVLVSDLLATGVMCYPTVGEPDGNTSGLGFPLQFYPPLLACAIASSKLDTVLKTEHLAAYKMLTAFRTSPAKIDKAAKEWPITAPSEATHPELMTIHAQLRLHGTKTSRSATCLSYLDQEIEFHARQCGSHISTAEYQDALNRCVKSFLIAFREGATHSYISSELVDSSLRNCVMWATQPNSLTIPAILKNSSHLSESGGTFGRFALKMGNYFWSLPKWKPDSNDAKAKKLSVGEYLALQYVGYFGSKDDVHRWTAGCIVSNPRTPMLAIQRVLALGCLVLDGGKVSSRWAQRIQQGWDYVADMCLSNNKSVYDQSEVTFALCLCGSSFAADVLQSKQSNLLSTRTPQETLYFGDYLFSMMGYYTVTCSERAELMRSIQDILHGYGNRERAVLSPGSVSLCAMIAASIVGHCSSLGAFPWNAAALKALKIASTMLPKILDNCGYRDIRHPIVATLRAAALLADICLGLHDLASLSSVDKCQLMSRLAHVASTVNVFSTFKVREARCPARVGSISFGFVEDFIDFPSVEFCRNVPTPSIAFAIVLTGLAAVHLRRAEEIWSDVIFKDSKKFLMSLSVVECLYPIYSDLCAVIKHTISGGKKPLVLNSEALASVRAFSSSRGEDRAFSMKK